MRCVFAFLFAFALTNISNAVSIDKGVLDLRDGALDKVKEVDFTGEWEFYWQKFYDYSQFAHDNAGEPSTYVNVPMVWNTFQVDGQKIPAHTYGTYRLKVLLDNTDEPLAIKFGSISTAFKAYVDDQLIKSAGRISSTEENAEPGYSTGMVIFQPPADTFNIIIQVSNFHYCKGGVWNDISTIGKADKIQQSWGKQIELLLLLLGCIVIIIIYHIGLYYLNRSFKSALYFAAFCIVIGLRAISINEIYILNLFPNFNWYLLVRIEYLTLTLGAIIFVLFIEGLLPKYKLKKPSRIVLAINGLVSLIILITPIDFFTRQLLFVQLAMLLGIIYTLYVAIRGLINKERLAQILILGLTVLILTVLNDILYVNRVIITAYLTTYGFMFFLVSQAFMLSYQYQVMFNETRQLALNLEDINKNLEKTVEERTREIKEQNGKLVEQNEEIKAQRDNIEKQHSIVKRQKQVITDSINYAERIQRAVLPSNNVFTGHLKDHFILFKPRDIVSGDFYWFSNREDKLIIVAADCTGHGVPGAFMSMLGMAFLAEVSRMPEVNTPAKMLEFMREKVKQSLNQYDKNSLQKEGMDMALCVYDKKSRMMEFSGAYSPLYIIRNNELMVYKGDRQPVAVYLRERSFTNNTIRIEPNDRMYIFSDGFADQTQAQSMQKFMVKNFKNLLLEIHQLPMQKQKERLENELSNWQGEGQQIDDILVIGFQV